MAFRPRPTQGAHRRRSPLVWAAELPRQHLVAVMLSVGVLAGQLVRLPPLADPLGAPIPEDWQLTAPIGYTIGAPLFSLWDSVAMLSRSRLAGFLVGLGLAWLIWRVAVRWRRRIRPARVALEELGLLVAGIVFLAAFVGVGMVWRDRPAVRLAGLAGDHFTIEIHSHTNASHDVRGWLVGGFDLAASLRWHEHAGVDLLFVTDHNTTAGWQRGTDAPTFGGAITCPGIEISAHGAHVVVLGTALPADPIAYRGDAERRAALFQEVAATPMAIAIASLPEYRGRAEAFAAEGVAGFEIVNASPKANELPRAERDSVVRLAEARGLALVAAGDQHGYGATAMAWNVMQLSGWRALGASLCDTVVTRLRGAGPGAVRIAERTRLRPDHALPAVLTPLGVLAMTWATIPPAAAASWLLWIWGVAIGARTITDALRRRRTRAILSAVGTFHQSPPGRR